MDIIESAIKKIGTINANHGKAAKKHLDNLAKPAGSLGMLEDLAQRVALITGDNIPFLDKKAIFTFAGDHGVTAEGVSAYPKEVTVQMVFNFLRGGAAINVLAGHAGADVVIVDIGVDHNFNEVKGLVDMKVINGTKNFMRGPAMTREEAVKCIAVGISLADGYAARGYMMFGAGDMGIGNTTPSSAIAAVLTGKKAADVTGRGTGISDKALANKIKVIKEGIKVNAPDPLDAVDVLAKIGGAEIGGIAGLILGAAANRIPVVIDGFISTAGAAIAYVLEPKVKDYLFAAHKSVEIGHTALLDMLGLTPILDLKMRLGEGTGAAIAMTIIDAGLKIYREMATFGDAGVSGRTAPE
jgi:nicotinate-nucleotide--dimethylbenzimidazole phosphoribosyltransferase